MSGRHVPLRWSAATAAATALLGAVLVSLPPGGAAAAGPVVRSAATTPAATPAPPVSPATPSPTPSRPWPSTDSPPHTGITDPPPSTPPCVPPNGTVRWVSRSSIAFDIPGSSCYPQAIFNVTLYLSAEDAAAYRNPAARGSGDRTRPYFEVHGLTPTTAYWYRFDGAVVAGPVRTTSSTVSASPSGPTPATCTAGYRVLSQWPGGFYAEVTVTAAGAALTGWSLGWTLAPGQRVEHAWGAVTTVADDGTVVARNAAWNGAVAANSGTTMGFVGSWRDSNPVPAVSCR